MVYIKMMTELYDQKFKKILKCLIIFSSIFLFFVVFCCFFVARISSLQYLLVCSFLVSNKVSTSLLISIRSPDQATVILFRPLGSSKWRKVRICL